MRPRLIIIGGFLGAGKTTLIASAVRLLAARGLKAAAITNDQGEDLVDSALLAGAAGEPAMPLPVAEVTAGCFCCRFVALLAASQQLQEAAVPDVILAEPVGSCTDLQATVQLPLQRLHPTRYALAPLSIAVDALRLLHFIRQEYASILYDDLAYLFAKQIEEAELLLLNKCDLLPSVELAFLQNWLRAYAPALRVLPVTARSGAGLDAWLEQVLRETAASSAAQHVLDLDYSRYARAEACLGWLNARGTLLTDEQTSPAAVLSWAEETLQTLVARLEAADLAIAHIKLLLSGAPPHSTPQPSDAPTLIKASVIGPAPALISWDARTSDLPARGTRWLLNARVAADPAILEGQVRAIIAEPRAGVHSVLESCACFQPAAPQPQHRLSGELS